MYGPKMHVIVVGGTWDTKGGKPSSVIRELYKGIHHSRENTTAELYNGGDYKDILRIITECLIDADAIVWAVNIPNELPKVRDIKKLYPKKLLVTTKNTIGRKTTIQDIISHGLALKSNLMIPITSCKGCYFGKIICPLGNMWFGNTHDFRQLGREVAEQLRRLIKVTRKPTIQYDDVATKFPINKETKEFLSYVMSCAVNFHCLIHPAAQAARFLGNSSFRCEKGFPSMRANEQIFLSKRNVDKHFINREAFVHVWLNSNKDVCYDGKNKPSVDTPIQLRLYEKLHDINYMVHGHVYVLNAPYTRTMVPCGGIEEVDEVMRVVADNDLYHNKGFAVNLRGHGCIVFGSHTDNLKRFAYTARMVPEKMGWNYRG